MYTSSNMDPIVFFVVLVIFYGVALFFDLFFKSCMHYPYEAFLHNTGLQVQFLRLKWHTTALNRTIFRWASSCSRILTQSFNIGVLVTVIILPIGVGILLLTLFESSSNSSSSAGTKISTAKVVEGNKISDTRIEIFLPGINLPLDEIGFYILTLIVCSVVHELGHALAAVLEDIPVSGFGLKIYFCIPIAYTEISSEHLNGIKGIRKMRVLCGGIWHNVILTAFCYLLLLTLGAFLSPFYKVNESIIITEINQKSPLIGERGLYVNDVITKINDCQVYDVDSWFDCLLNSIKNKPAFCVSSDFIRLSDESSTILHGRDGLIQCCDPNNIKLSCFEHVNDDDADGNGNPIEIPQHVCLNIRKTVEDSFEYCTIRQRNRCKQGGFCIKPLLNNSTTIIILSRMDKPHVIYIGHPTDLSKTIKISQFVPKVQLFRPKYADSILLFLKYNIVFSLGLAIINSIPCFGLDGYHIMSTIINSYLVTKITERGKRDLLVLLICSLGTLLFMCSIIKILWLSLFIKIF